MNLDNLIQVETKEFISILSGYLNQEITHIKIQAYIDRIFDKWENLNIDEGTPYSKGEKEFWCSVWSTQHLASEDHWKDGITQVDLGLILKVLKGQSVLPSGYTGKRP